MMMRMICDGPLRNTASLGSPGVDEVRWTKPVRPGRRAELPPRLHGEARSGVATRCRHLQDHRRTPRRQGRGAGWWHTNQLTRRRHPGVAAGRAERAQAAARAARQPVGHARPAAATRRAACSSRTARSARSPISAAKPSAATRSSPLPASSIRSLSISMRPPPRLPCSAPVRLGLAHVGDLHPPDHHPSLRRQDHTERSGARRPVYGPSPGFRNLRWPKPVYVGDTIEFRARICREDRPQVAPRPRHPRQRSAGPQPARRHRVRPHVANPGGSARAVPAGRSTTITIR